MTTTYEATGMTCYNCGAEVEDYTGHLEASEITVCESCPTEVREKAEYRAAVVHVVPRK